MGKRKTLVWPDLKPYGIRLGLFRASHDQRLYMVVLHGDRHGPVLERLGFRRRRTGHWVQRPEDLQACLKAVFKAFPKARRRRLDLSDRRDADWLFFRDSGRRETGPDSAAPAEAANEHTRLAQMTYLGRNHLGFKVYENLGERVALDPKRERLTRESDLKAPRPADFLRAPDARALILCAEGFLRGVLEDEQPRLARVAVTCGVDPARFARAVHDALGRLVLRHRAPGIADTYQTAVRLTEALRAHGGHREASASPSAPLGVVLRRLATHAGAERALLVGATGPEALIALPSVAHASVQGPPSRLEGLLGESLADTGAVEEALDGWPETAVQILLLEGDLSGVDAAPYLLGENVVPEGPLSALLRALEARDADGVTVAVLPDAPVPEASPWWDWLRANYHLEGAARVHRTLAVGVDTADPGYSLVLAIGARRARPEPDADAPRLRRLDGFEELWQWSSEVLAARRRARAAIEVEQAGTADVELSAFQAPYTPASRVGEPVSRVPRHLDAATREALVNLIRRRGDIDEYVRDRLGWTREELAERLLPEQVDAVALALDAIERGAPFVVGDQMGLGKGRVCAALAAFAVRNGGRVVFLTETAQLFSDFWRDVRDIGAEILFRDGERRPFILNSGAAADVIDKRTGEALFDAGGVREKIGVIRGRRWPEGANLIMATYSQFSAKASPKAQWLKAIIDESTLVIADESQNQTGSSQRARNLRDIAENAMGVVYSSGTMAHNIQTLLSYRDINPPGMSKKELGEVLRRGGEIMQEVIAADLVRRGYMIRRELPAVEARLALIHDETNEARNRAYIDQVAPIFSALARLSNDISRIVAERNLEDADQAERMAVRRAFEAGRAVTDETRRAARRDAMRLASTSFGSPLYTLGQLLLLSLKADFAVERALAALERGEKPVILVQNTLETLLRDLMQDGGARARLPEHGPDFKDVLRRIVDRVTRVTRRERGRTVTLPLDQIDPALPAARARILEMIDRLPPLPASPIDVIRDRIEDAGYRCEELTGRKWRWSRGALVAREEGTDNEIQHRFNSGETDALVITKTTGYSIHAARACADQRRRVMIELQSHSDPRRLLQALRRVDRLDQVHPPRYEVLTTGLPVDYRLLSHRNKKVARVAAITAADTEHPALVSGVVDMFNRVGDLVVRRYLEPRPDLARRLGIDPPEVDERSVAALEGLGAPDRTWANILSSRFWLLPSAEQERIFDEVMNEYQATLADLEAMGLNPLRKRELPGTWKTVRRDLFEAAGAGIDEPLWVSVIQGEIRRRPISADELLRLIDEGRERMGVLSGAEVAERLEAQRDALLRAALADSPAYPSVDAALAAEEDNAVKRCALRLERMAGLYREMEPGCELLFRDALDAHRQGIIVEVCFPPEGMERIASAAWIKMVRRGAEEVEQVSLETLLLSSRVEIRPGLNGATRDGILAAFRFSGGERTVTETHRVLEGNLVRAVQFNADHRLGSLVVWRDERGVTHRGIRLARPTAHLDMLPARFSDPRAVVEYVMAHPRTYLFGGKDCSSKHGALRHDGEVLRLELPSRHVNGELYERVPWLKAYLAHAGLLGDRPRPERIGDERVRQWHEAGHLRARKARRRAVLEFTDAETAVAVIGQLMEGGLPFYGPGDAREWINEWHKRSMARQAAEREARAMEAPEVQAYMARAEEAAREAVSALLGA